jgi:hypothetical protein
MDYAYESNMLNDSLKDKQIVFDRFADTKLKKLIEKENGIVVMDPIYFNISTDIIIYADEIEPVEFEKTFTYEQALEHNIQCMSKSQFLKTYNLNYIEPTGFKYNLKLVVFAGFQNYRWQMFIESKGGMVSDDPTDFTTLIIYSSTSSIAYIEGEKIGSWMISKSEFENLYEDELKNFKITSEDDVETSIDEFIEVDTEDSKQLCRLVKKHLPTFFDDIYVPYDSFKEGNWDIPEVLSLNFDSLFYNEKYMAEADNDRFYEVFDKYLRFIEPILQPTSELAKSMESWSTKKINTQLKKIIIGKKYHIISPLLMIQTYKKLCKEHKNETKEFVRAELKKCLDKILGSFHKEIDLFKIEFDKIVTDYVYTYPLNGSPKYCSTYIKGFINSIILIILELVDKLIDLQIYAIHGVVADLINYYVPLDIINSYDVDDHDGKKLVTI